MREFCVEKKSFDATVGTFNYGRGFIDSLRISVLWQ